MSTKARKEAVAEGRDTYDWTGRVSCGICGHTWKAQIPVPTEWEEPIVSLECPKCESMAGSPD